VMLGNGSGAKDSERGASTFSDRFWRRRRGECAANQKSRPRATSL
jgi:hypothetical protein